MMKSEPSVKQSTQSHDLWELSILFGEALQSLLFEILDSYSLKISDETHFVINFLG